MQEGRPLYNIDRVIRESGKTFNDGSKIVYVNSQCRDDTALGKLMQDMYCTDPAQLNYKEFAPRMEQLKNKKEVSVTMRDLFEEYAQLAATRMAQDMAQGMAKDMAQGMAKDMAQGMAKDMAQGMAKDMAQGMAKDMVKEAEKKAQEAVEVAEKETKKNTLKDMACRMLMRGDSVEEVVEITSLPLESVRALQLQL